MQRHRLRALAVVAAGLMAYNAPAAAQGESRTPAPTPADSGRRMFDPVSRLMAQRGELKLTDEQATKLEAIRTKYMETNKTRMEEFRRDREKHAAFQSSMDSTRKEVMAVLTPEQQKQVEQMRKQWRSEWKNKHGGRHDHGHGDDDRESSN